eukprot:5149873-Prymnesium_polylepis.1
MWAPGVIALGVIALRASQLSGIIARPGIIAPVAAPIPPNCPKNCPACSRARYPSSRSRSEGEAQDDLV